MKICKYVKTYSKSIFKYIILAVFLNVFLIDTQLKYQQTPFDKFTEAKKQFDESNKT